MSNNQLNDLETERFEQRIRLTLDAPAPDFSTDDARRVASETFGIEATATLMTSERDQNFLIRTPAGDGFILKIANSAEDLSVLDFQNQAMETVRIHAPDIPSPRIRRTLDGKLLATVSRATATYGVRMLAHFPGLPQSRCGPSSAAFRREIGRVSGAMGAALAALSHPSADYPLLWDMKHAARLRRFLPFVEQAEERRLVALVLDRFHDDALPMLRQLPSQPIHNDFNRNNIILDPASLRLTGIIDFGDAVAAPRIVDLAVTAAHQIYDQADPLTAAGEVVAAYGSIVPLSLPELHLLPVLICTRLMMRIAIKGWRQATYPERPAYYEPGLDEMYFSAVETLLAGNAAAERLGDAAGRRADMNRQDSKSAKDDT